MQTSAVGGLTFCFEACPVSSSFKGQYLQGWGTQESPFVSEMRASVSALVARDRWFVATTSLRQEPKALVSDSDWCTPNEGGIRAGLDVVQDWRTAPPYSALPITTLCTVVYYVTTKTERIPQILRKIGANSPHGNALATRLQYLMSAAEEEAAQDPGLTQASIPSLTDFAEFLATQPRIAKPSLTLTWDGHVRAEWRKDADHRVAAEFIGDGTAKLVIFAPDPNDPTRVVRFSRQVEVPALVQTVGSYAVPFLAETT